MRAFAECSMRPPLTALAAALSPDSKGRSTTGRGGSARPRKLPNFGNGELGLATASARQQLRFRVQLACLGEALPRIRDLSGLRLDAGCDEPETPVGLIVLERRLDRHEGLVWPARALPHAR